MFALSTAEKQQSHNSYLKSYLTLSYKEQLFC